MGDQNPNISGQAGSNPLPENTEVNPSPNPAEPPHTEETKQNYNFSSLGLNFSTQFIAGKRIVSSFVSIFLLLVGLSAGVVLVTQPQLLQKKAQVNQNVSTPACDEAQKCTTDAVNAPNGSHPCLARNGVMQCCPKGTEIINNNCTDVSAACDPEAKCTQDSKIFGPKPCTNPEGGISFCCNRGDNLIHTFGFCYHLPF